MVMPGVALLIQPLAQVRALALRYWLLLFGAAWLIQLGPVPLVGHLADLAVHHAGLTFVTDRNLATVLSTPLSVALLVAALAVIAITTLAAFGLFLVIAHLQSSPGEPSISAVHRRLRVLLRSMFRIESLLLTLQLAFIAPLGGFGLFAPLTADVALPPFIGREFLKTAGGTGLWCAITAVIIYVNVRLMLTVPFSIVRGSRPARSVVDSLRATGRGGLRFALVLTLASVGAVVMSRIGAGLGGMAVDTLSRVFPGTAELAEGGVRVVTAVLGIAAAQGFAFLLIGRARTIPGRPPICAQAHRRAPGSHLSVAICFAAATVVVFATVGSAMPDDDPAAPASLGRSIVLAHRGYDASGVENTIQGLEAAARFAPDYVEVDVQQTRDGDFVASHDTNLLMLAGVDKNIYDMSTADVIATTVTMKGHSATIPTMTAYVEHAKKLKVPLLIELKVTGHERGDYVSAMLDDLKKADAIAGNIFHSLDPAVVTAIKDQYPELRVGLTIAMFRGSLPVTPGDFYTVEQAAISPDLIEAAHAENKEIYAWTVNDRLTMRELLGQGVDGIVTDHPDVARASRDLVESQSLATDR